MLSVQKKHSWCIIANFKLVINSTVRLIFIALRYKNSFAARSEVKPVLRVNDDTAASIKACKQLYENFYISSMNVQPYLVIV
jgi:hypothetical protein